MLDGTCTLGMDGKTSSQLKNMYGKPYVKNGMIQTQGRRWGPGQYETKKQQNFSSKLSNKLNWDSLISF